MHRRALLAFGVLFAALFFVVAIVEGVGDPSVPSGGVALVEDTPGDTGKVSQERFDHALELVAKQAGEKKAPKPGEPKYEELKEPALNSLFESIWVQGLAAEEGIEVSKKERDRERKKVENESFQSKEEFKKFLNESGYTSADVNERVEQQILSAKLQEGLREKAPRASGSEVENYYEAAKATQFMQPATREVRLIVNKDREKAKAALRALSRDDSVKNWKKVAKEYSEDSVTKEKGGLQEGVQKETLEEPLSEAVFNAPEGQVEGPLKTPRGFTVFEVIDSIPEGAQELSVVKSQIENTLTQQVEQEYFDAYLVTFQTTWMQRTFCAPGFVIERCSNFEGSGHSETAPEGCYEANPKGGPPDACPAPVNQLVPALPGTVTPLEPKGKPLAQRPRPLEEEAAESSEALPEGIVPPTEE